jgi:hypothetical protein
MDSVALRNLRTLQAFGFHFSVHDFVVGNDGVVEAHNVDAVIRGKVRPKFVIIAEEIWDRLKRKTVRLSRK